VAFGRSLAAEARLTVHSGSTLSFSQFSKDGQLRLAVVGELDIASAPALLAEIERFERETPDTLALDLGGVTFMDVSGMRVLLEAAQRARNRAAEFVIFNPRSCASRVFGLTAVDQQLRIAFDEQPS
jgi:anti-sigma B factor antagonist